MTFRTEAVVAQLIKVKRHRQHQKAAQALLRITHPIIVLTDSPIRQILAKPDQSGRLTKWAIELSIYYIPPSNY